MAEVRRESSRGVEWSQPGSAGHHNETLQRERLEWLEQRAVKLEHAPREFRRVRGNGVSPTGMHPDRSTKLREIGGRNEQSEHAGGARL